jgi:hypothetical protein
MLFELACRPVTCPLSHHEDLGLKLMAHCSTVSINKGMDDDPPLDQLVVPINMPESIWAANMVFAMMDGFSIS